MAHRTDTVFLKPTAEQMQLLYRHAGARRFAYNACVAHVRRLLARGGETPRPKLPWSSFDNINYINAFKRSPEAGVTKDGIEGLAWRREVHQQVFEEGAKDFGLAMTSWGKHCKARSTKSLKAGRKVGPPQFSSRRTGKLTFRMRKSTNSGSLALTDEGLRVPRLGLLALRGSTRKLRRLLRVPKDPSKAAKIAHVTFSFDRAKLQWKASLAIAWEPSLPATPAQEGAIGCDVGIHALAVSADAHGGHVAFHLAPKAIACGIRRSRRAQRNLSLKRLASLKTQEAKGASHREVSNSEKRARRKLSLRHARIKNIRRAHMHAVTRQLVQTHERIGIEGLHIRGMLKNHKLAGAIARQAWGEFLWQVQYKAAWLGKTVVVAPRFFPSTKRCSQCGVVKAEMPLALRVFRCDVCLYTADRDVNSARNLAWLAQQSEPVHGKYSVKHAKIAGAGTGREPLRGSPGLRPAASSQALRSRKGTGRRSTGTRSEALQRAAKAFE